MQRANVPHPAHAKPAKHGTRLPACFSRGIRYSALLLLFCFCLPKHMARSAGAYSALYRQHDRQRCGVRRHLRLPQIDGLSRACLCQLRRLFGNQVSFRSSFFLGHGSAAWRVRRCDFIRIEQATDARSVGSLFVFFVCAFLASEPFASPYNREPYCKYRSVCGQAVKRRSVILDSLLWRNSAQLPS